MKRRDGGETQGRVKPRSRDQAQAWGEVSGRGSGSGAGTKESPDDPLQVAHSKYAPPPEIWHGRH